MDVHPPHEPIDSWRAFLIHLATITIGLLIALSLEAIVEYMHHRHTVHRALETIQLEIAQNREFLKGDLNDTQEDQARIRDDLRQLVELRAGKKLEKGALQYSIRWSSFNDAAWRTARDTGALSYMDYQTARGLSDLYKQQDFVSTEALRIFSLQTRAIGPYFITEDYALMSKEEVQLTLQRSADLFLDLKGLQSLLLQLDAQFKEQQEKQAH